MSVSFSYIEESMPINAAIPSRKPNGGLYTGKQATGPWGNHPVTPEPIALAHNLLSAKPPKNAEKQPTTFLRPGNNPIEYPWQTLYNSDYSHMQCMK